MAKPRMEGTHNPTNKAPWRSPKYQRVSATMSDIKANANMVISILFSLLNIRLIVRCYNTVGSVLFPLKSNRFFT